MQLIYLGGADSGTKVSFPALAEDAVVLLALRGVARDHHIPHLDRRHAFAYRFHDGRGFVAEDGREQALGVVAVERVDVGVAESIGDHLHSDLAGFGRSDLKMQRKSK